VSFYAPAARLSTVAFPWEPFLERYRGLARNVAAGILGGRDEAEDLVQEAAAALLAALRREPGRFASLEHARNYFLKTVRNLALKQHRRTPPLQADDEIPATALDDDLDTLQERRLRLRTALLSLSDDERDLIARRYHGLETLAQVSSDTGIPVSTLHSREQSILARLRRKLGAEGDAPHPGAAPGERPWRTP
jgi:RNA polymerase sigma factor (sigma-70 family)